VARILKYFGVMIEPIAIGQILLIDHLISEDQLEDALQNQKFFHGRLGTQLVDLGFIGVAQLEEVLSRKFGVPQAMDAELETISRNCLHQFPVEALQRFQMIPYKMNSQSLFIGMVNPNDQKAIEWIGSQTNLKIVVTALSEIKFHYFLFRHFRGESDVRIRNLYFEYLKEKCKRKLSDKKSEPPGRKLFTTDLNKLLALGIKPLDANEELSSEGDQEVLLQGLIQYHIDPPPPPPLHTSPPQKAEEFTPEFADISNF